VTVASFLITGTICTMNPALPWAEALVVRGRDIVYVGTRDGAAAHVDSGTERLHVPFAMPGFIDAHNHLASMASMLKVGVDVSGVADPREMVDRVRRYAADHPQETVVRGHGWMPAYFPGESPTRALLDEAVPERPALLMSNDGHDSWFNTAAMRACGIDASTPDPEPGAQYWKREPDGTPSGHGVEGTPTLTMLGALGAFTPEGVRQAQELTLDRAAQWGITAYFEAGIVLGPNVASEPVYVDLMERDARGELDVRIVGSVWTRESSDEPSDVVAALADWSRRLRSEHVQVSVLKMWADGTALSGGGLLLEPWLDTVDGSCGRMTFSAQHIERQVELCQLAGFDMHIHNDGDGSVRTILDAIERVQSRIGRGQSRHTVCHNALVHPDDVPRFAQLGLVANVTPLWATDYDGMYYDMYLAKLGWDRFTTRLYPYGDLMRSGAIVTYGADSPGVQLHEIPPLLQIEAAVTRRRPGFPQDRALNPLQRVTVSDALRAYTAHAAYQLRLDKIVGSLEVGKRADIVGLGADPFEVSPPTLHEIPVALTMMDGRVTHDDQ